MEQYQNRDGVLVTAEQVIDEPALAGFWQITDANGVQSHIPDEQFSRAFSLVTPAADAPAGRSKK